MHRREFLKVAAGAFAIQPITRAQGDGWRTFELTTELRLDRPGSSEAVARAWLPLAYPGAREWQRVIKQVWRGNAATMRAVREEGGAGVLFVEWAIAEAVPEVVLTLHVASREPVIDWTDRTTRGVRRPQLRNYLRPMRSIVLSNELDEARRVVGGERDDVSRARAAYERVIVASLRAGDDPAAVFVALVRAAGTPARVIAGVRVAGDATSAQVLRAEFHSARHGWVPVDPAAARRALAQRDISAAGVEYVRRRYFGSWDGPWIAFNDAHDVRLPSDPSAVQPFFVRPQAFPGPARYIISARELDVGTAW